MAQNNFWKNLGTLINGQSVRPEFVKSDRHNLSVPDPVIYQASSKEDRQKELTKLSQQKFLSYQWVNARNNIQMDNIAGATASRLMYRDADLMDSSPEIGAALDIMAEEACANDTEGKMLHIYSSSKRIKSILEDLFTNRLNINITLPQIARGVQKYGNHYMLLNLDTTNGVMGWMRLPVYDMQRIEGAFNNGTSAGVTQLNSNTNNLAPEEVRFVWLGRNEDKPYFNWEVAHFRNLTDSFMLPYGISCLHKARRAWRMWSMMEDAMLIYRQERSVERRVFKIYVGAIDDADVPAYINQIADNFKRTPIIDPQTGQIDLRKNIMANLEDIFIPVRREDAPTPIDALPSQQSITSMDDINYMQNKIFAALRVPKTFLNFQEAQGKGQNLSLMDIRFCRMINKLQQYLLLELNKIAMIHLYLLGFRDDVSNFALSLTNPSAQIEALELEDTTKRIQTAASALADPGTGIPLLSQHWVLKKIMKLTDSEIRDIFNEIRLEKAMANELQNTPNVISKTHVFDDVDRIYGDIKALVKPTGDNGGDGEGPNGGGGGPAGMPNVDMGNSLNMDSLGGGPGEDFSDMSGTATEAPMQQASDLDSGKPQPQEAVRFDDNRPLLVENNATFFEQYMNILAESDKKEKERIENAVDYVGKNTDILNEQIMESVKQLNGISGESDSKVNELEDEINKLNEAEQKVKKTTKKTRKKK